MADRAQTQPRDGDGSAQQNTDLDAHVAAETVHRLKALAPTGTCGMSVGDQTTAEGATRRPLTTPSDLEAAIALVDEQFGGPPYMTTRQALSLGALIMREGLCSLLELGTYHGKSTAYMAAVLETAGRGNLVTIDRVDARAKNPNVYHILKSSELSHRVEVHLEPRSLTW